MKRLPIKEHHMNKMTTEKLDYGYCTVTLHRPMLSEEERAKRLEEVKKAAIRLLTIKEN